MNNKALWGHGALTTAMLIALTYQGITVWQEKEGEKPKKFRYITNPLTSMLDVTEQSRLLETYTNTEFTKEVVSVGNRAYVAIGFAFANSIMIEGDDGIIIVDTTESSESAQDVMDAFRNITDRPVKAIILTNFHSDKIFGIQAILEYEKQIFPNQTIDIYANEETETLSEFAATNDVGITRSLRAYGVFLPESVRAGPEAKLSVDAEFQIPRPTVTFKKNATYSVAGITFQLIHTPGAAEDQTSIWLPDDLTLLPGDNFVKVFPDLSPIRGMPTPDPEAWYQSLDRIRDLGAEYLVPSHATPIEGKDEIQRALQTTRDGIKFIHDQTLRLLKYGYTPDDIIDELRLPGKLGYSPYLAQHFGTIEWSVRGIFERYIGWFSGDPIDLEPMTNEKQNEKLVELIKHAQANPNTPHLEILLQNAQNSLMRSSRRYKRILRTFPSEDKWAYKLADAITQLEENPELLDVAKTIKISALRALGVSSISAQGRNYYLTYALELEQNLVIERSKESRISAIKSASVKTLLEMLCSNSNGRLCTRNNFKVAFDFTDIATTFGVTLRNGVCDVIENFKYDVTDKSVVELTTPSQVWAEILAGEKDFRREFGMETVDIPIGDLHRFYRFMNCFEPVNGDPEFLEQWE